MDKPNYGISFDGTIAYTDALKTKWIRKNVGKDVNPWTLCRAQCIDLMGIDNYERMQSEISLEPTLEAEQIPEAIRGVKRLGKASSLYLITTRNGQQAEFAKEWLSQHGILGCFKDVKEINYSGKTKRDTHYWCGKLGIDLMIDNDISRLITIKRPNTAKVFLNEINTARIVENAPTGVRIARSWPSLLTMLDIK